MSSCPQAIALLALITAEIQRYGQSIVASDKLLVLISDTDPIGIQFGHIFAIAERERWSVEFRNDGTVRFATLEIAQTRAEVWPEPAGDLIRVREN